MIPSVQWLDDRRLHLQHGPIDLIIGADGAEQARAGAFAAAQRRFDTILRELVEELPALRQPVGMGFRGETARRMARAVSPHAPLFVTPMAAVAGAVADTILQAMCAVPLDRAYVNNGGDIALHLAPGAGFETAMMSAGGTELGRIEITSVDGIGGIATSGCHGRSLSLGIADSVTALASSAAAADAAATLIANAVDLPDCPLIDRVPAQSLDPDSDLRDLLVTTRVGRLDAGDIAAALGAGARRAQHMLSRGVIHGAALFLRGQSRSVGEPRLMPGLKRSFEHA